MVNQYYLTIIYNLNSFIFQLKMIMENWDPVIAQIGKCYQYKKIFFTRIGKMMLIFEIICTIYNMG